MDEMLPRAA